MGWKPSFWTEGWWRPTIEEALERAEFAKASTILFTTTGEPEDFAPYAEKVDGTWRFTATGYPLAVTA